MDREKRYNHTMGIVILGILLMMGISVCGRQTSFGNSMLLGSAYNQSGDVINRFDYAMCELTAINIQSGTSFGKVDDNSEQYKCPSNIRKRILLIYCLHETMKLLSIAWGSYILIMRKKTLNYLITINYIHKSDGQKGSQHILLNS